MPKTSFRKNSDSPPTLLLALFVFQGVFQVQGVSQLDF
jgi:hypothetical protein